MSLSMVSLFVMVQCGKELWPAAIFYNAYKMLKIGAFAFATYSKMHAGFKQGPS